MISGNLALFEQVCLTGIADNVFPTRGRNGRKDLRTLKVHWYLPPILTPPPLDVIFTQMNIPSLF